MTYLYIVRHGNTFAKGESPRRVGSKTNIPLVESGFDQADSLGMHFFNKKINFSKVYSSPLLRAQQTTQKILQQLNSKIEIESLDLLNEIDHGPDENKIESEVEARIGKHAIQEWDENAIVPDGWIVDYEQRIAGWKQFIEDHKKCGNILMVTSNGAARFLLQAYHLKEAHRNLKLRTGSYGCVAVTNECLSLKSWDIRPES
ncbi:MAG: histidine phosphatase family protein [Gammaproteobacteria bacterium]|nr:histidine phosphatase family protein [Gammaproteobacteria bacterium]MCK5608249.1 histidine phosphatase family protein [Candidatus Pacearchaeota archaeon]